MPKSKSSIHILHESARHVVLPDGIVSTSWPVVSKKCRDLGITFDPWQDAAGQLFFAKREDGRFAASRGGAVLSIPRQVGKTFLIGAVVFAMCLLEEKSKVIWTAHRTTTADETFESMQEMAKLPNIWPFVSRVRQANGEQRIIFTNGSRIEFGAREMGFGRGKAEVKILVLDEGQIMSESAMENLVPTMNRAHNPMMFIMGTPPRPIDNSEMFENKRRRALSGESKDSLYIEFSADRKAKIEDRKQWAIANPSYPAHTDEDAMLRMMESFGADSFKREALGIWDETSSRHVAFPAGAWEARAIESPSEDWPVAAIGVDMNPDRTWVSVSFAFFADDGLHVELIETEPFTEGGSKELVRWIKSVAMRRVPVVIDSFSPARTLEPLLREARCTVRILTSAEFAQACMGMHDAVVHEEVTHYDQDELNMSVNGATKRPVGKAGAWAFARDDLDVDLTPIISCVCAHFGAIKFARKPSVTAGSSEDVEVDVL